MTESELLRRYSVRRKPGGSWTLGDRWELLFDGKDWLGVSVTGQYLPIGNHSAATKRGAFRKARRLARVNLANARTGPERVPLSGPARDIPCVDLRAETAR